ncbi:MAG TPA: AarF/UbiB family protein [Blastocatellia bacterium]|nr:AarF/UbiB family protein [Blastocatellia bacterium]
MTLIRLVFRAFEMVILLTFYFARLCIYSAAFRLFGLGSAPKSLLGHSLAKLFESLGATFIKIGQILSSRPDLLPPEIVAPLSLLQDRVAPFDSKKIPGLIRDAFGQPIEAIFEHFEMAPIFGASVAQVHKARLKDGREVAVKVRRPGIPNKVKGDLTLLRLCASTLSLIPAMRLVPLKELIEEFGQAVAQQLDFSIEAESNRRFRENFSGFDNIKFPVPVGELCTESILTMEFLKDLKKIEALDFTPDERKAVAIEGLRALYKMIFVDGFIHADLHPGNIFFRRGEVIFLDFGMTATLVGDDLKNFVDFFYGMASNNGKVCARVVYDTATFRTDEDNREMFEAAMVRMINEHSIKEARDFEVTQFAAELFDLQRRFGIRGTTKFTMTIVSLAVFEGIVKQLHPELDFQAEARQFILKAWTRTSLRHSPPVER